MNVFINGKLIPLEKANIPVMDRGFLYGDGVFESLRTYKKQPLFLLEHLKRLISSARFLKIATPSLSSLKSAVIKTIATNHSKECYAKIILTRGIAAGHGLDPSNTYGKSNLIVTVEKFKEPDPAIYRRGWKAIIATIRRTDVPTSRIKSLCYLDNVLAKAEASRAGASEAFMLDEKGNVVEGSASNFFIVKNGKLATPPTYEPILSGITRKSVIALARWHKLPVAEKKITPNELYRCDECFITLSSLGIVPVTKIGGRKIGRGRCGPITARLIALYNEKTRGR